MRGHSVPTKHKTPNRLCTNHNFTEQYYLLTVFESANYNNCKWTADRKTSKVLLNYQKNVFDTYVTQVFTCWELKGHCFGHGNIFNLESATFCKTYNSNNGNVIGKEYFFYLLTIFRYLNNIDVDPKSKFFYVYTARSGFTFYYTRIIHVVKQKRNMLVKNILLSKLSKDLLFIFIYCH